MTSIRRVQTAVNGPDHKIKSVGVDDRVACPLYALTAHTDTYHGRFVKLVANEQVVEVVEFETTDPALRGEMTITISLADADGGTDVLAVHDRLPRGLSTADNEAGWREALAKLASLVEAG